MQSSWLALEIADTVSGESAEPADEFPEATTSLNKNIFRVFGLFRDGEIPQVFGLFRNGEIPYEDPLIKKNVFFNDPLTKKRFFDDPLTKKMLSPWNP